MEKGRTTQQHPKKRSFPVGKDSRPQRGITSPELHKADQGVEAAPHQHLSPSARSAPPLPPSAFRAVGADKSPRLRAHILTEYLYWVYVARQQGGQPITTSHPQPPPKQSLWENVVNQAHVQDEKQTLWKMLL